MKSTAIAGLLAAAFLAGYGTGPARAMGKRPEQGRAAAASRLTPEQERQAKAEFDSLMAIYDPWKAIKEYTEQEESLKKSNTSKADILEALKEIDRKYTQSQNGDAVLSNIVLLYMNFSPQKDTTIEGERFDQHNPKYDEHYRETLEYALRLADEHPKSPYGEKILFYIGVKYAGGWEEKDGSYIKPYVELVKRYPQSKYILMPLYVISASTGFDTAMWAYILWNKKYNNYMFYGNILDDPVEEARYKEKKVIDKSREMSDGFKQEVGERLLNCIETSIGHSLSGYWCNNESIMEINTNDANKIYKLLSPYCRETDVFKSINPFEKYPDIKIKRFYANRERHNYTIKLFDVERTCSADKSVPKPRRRQSL